MTKPQFKYLYGPVYSWRLGYSLGIDPISTKDKACNFDCIYCQLGHTPKLTQARRNFVSVKALMEEIKELPSVPIDYLTFSGRPSGMILKPISYI